MSIKNYDWRKAAATAADDEAVEKAFMDQSYSFISNKAGPLMKSPHQLGFEVVYKNDANTRMVGIFAFRIDSDLLYAPVFFLNGEIKGTDLLYRHNTKTFVPLNKDWVSFLIEKTEQNSGRGLSKDFRRQMPTDVQIGKIAHPPNSYYHQKISSVAPDAMEDLLKSVGVASFEEWMDKVAFFEPLKPILHRFIVEDGGEQALAIIEKFASTSPVWTEALVRNCDESTYCPAELLTPREKKASAPSKLQLFLGQLPPGIKQAGAMDKFFKQGFLLVDDRGTDDLTPVYEDAEENMQGISGPGLYKIVLKDGTLETVFAAERSDEDIATNNGGCINVPCSIGVDPAQTNHHPDLALVVPNGATSIHNNVMGSQLKDVDEAIKDGDLKDSMESSKAYRIFNSHTGTLSDVVYVVGKRSKNGLTLYEIATKWQKTRELKQNPDYDGVDLPGGILGKGAYFVPVKCKATKREEEYCSGEYILDTDDISIGDTENLNNWIFSQGYKTASLLRSDLGGYQIRTGHLQVSDELGPVSTLVALTKNFKIAAATAENLIEKARKTGQVSFWMDLSGEKSAAVKVIGEPTFDQYYDSNFGVELDPNRYFNLDTESDTDDAPESRIGDAWDPSSGNGLPKALLMKADPAELAQFAKMQQLPQLFEHGAVGSLVNTFDSASMVDKYVPDLEKALDGLGRILFLFYWKPGDFEDAYGSDDMANMENEILSSFKSFGDLVLNLLKKSKSRTLGNPALPS